MFSRYLQIESARAGDAAENGSFGSPESFFLFPSRFAREARGNKRKWFSSESISSECEILLLNNFHPSVVRNLS